MTKLIIGGLWNTFQFNPDTKVWVEIEGNRYEGTLQTEIEVLSESPIEGGWWQIVPRGFNEPGPVWHSGEGVVRELRIKILPVNVGGLEIPVDFLNEYFFPDTFKVSEGGVPFTGYKICENKADAYDLHPKFIHFYCPKFELRADGTWRRV